MGQKAWGQATGLCPAIIAQFIKNALSCIVFKAMKKISWTLTLYHWMPECGIDFSKRIKVFLVTGAKTLIEDTYMGVNEAPSPPLTL